MRCGKMSGMKLWPRLVILALFSALPVIAQTKPLVFFNVDVFDGYHILRGQTVKVENGMIRSITAAGVRPPESAAVINGAGRTLLPGLIDAHVHIGLEETLEQAAALGVTTVLDMWGDPSTLIPLKKEIERGEHPNAGIFGRLAPEQQFRVAIQHSWPGQSSRRWVPAMTCRRLSMPALRKARII